jgi:hypothetical protein
MAAASQLLSGNHTGAESMNNDPKQFFFCGYGKQMGVGGHGVQADVHVSGNGFTGTGVKSDDIGVVIVRRKDTLWPGCFIRTENHMDHTLAFACER